MDQASKDKAQTKGKLIAAVGQLLATEGPAALGINRIARQAGVNKKLIYRYFGGKDRLIESYITENDYWLIQAQAITDLQQPSQTELQQQLTELLQNQFRYFLSHPNMQDLILWELNTKSLMKSIHIAREHVGQALFEKLTTTSPKTTSAPSAPSSSAASTTASSTPATTNTNSATSSLTKPQTSKPYLTLSLKSSNGLLIIYEQVTRLVGIT
ncbi:TetR/AcrR family transcriptional regulator [Mucilaginibacter auburnensis]|uniref:Regulatory TetR family protein n=1 Tax=Mucilaginibacter auburnensis TaxID=1457233 RepID=A0A2H9VLM8_9SPHI|nr:TetR/AcrR family transcriptional regulator [Mucilaginibacter auburnensis]PJJ79248.1 regulatory TetR family protein [Mucilaginibacter auburnensis]